MKERFPGEDFGRRWRAERVFSRLKRRLGPCLRSRTDQGRTHERFLRVLTHNLMIL